MSEITANDQWFERLADRTGPEFAPASSRLKSRLYSALMQAEAADGPLASLSACQGEGRELCFWEHLIQLTPLPATVKSLNHCHACHARLLAERIEGVPLPWRGCPYADFQK